MGVCDLSTSPVNSLEGLELYQHQTVGKFSGRDLEAAIGVDENRLPDRPPRVAPSPDVYGQASSRSYLSVAALCHANHASEARAAVVLPRFRHGAHPIVAVAKFAVDDADRSGLPADAHARRGQLLFGLGLVVDHELRGAPIVCCEQFQGLGNQSLGPDQHQLIRASVRDHLAGVAEYGGGEGDEFGRRSRPRMVGLDGSLLGPTGPCQQQGRAEHRNGSGRNSATRARISRTGSQPGKR